MSPRDWKTIRLVIVSPAVVVLAVYLGVLLLHPRNGLTWDELTADGMQPNDWMIFFSVPPAH